MRGFFFNGLTVDAMIAAFGRMVIREIYLCRTRIEKVHVDIQWRYNPLWVMTFPLFEEFAMIG